VTTVEVDRTDLRRTRVVERPPALLADGAARLRVDAFALTANNVTYAVAGDQLGYWSVFPTDEPWGRIPVWGYADVVESRHPAVAVGTRCYGYLPMSTELVVEPGRVGPGGFSDTAEHRAGLAGAYNHYEGVPVPPPADGPTEDQRMVLFPLFVTSFLIDDALADGDTAGTRVVLTSASSKTAIGTAFCASRREGAEVVGLTSPANRGFVEGLGAYHRVLTYDEVGEIDAAPSTLVDIAGSAPVRAAVHERLGDALARSITVGNTHWEAAPAAGDLPGPSPEFFFAPSRIARRTADWGADGLASRRDEAWAAYARWTEGWLRIERGVGAGAVESVYRSLLDGRADPAVGHVLTLHV
jgi:hypothetical protein